MFPLNLVVFPEENLNLHIFEPRYRELVADCLLFGIPSVSKNQVMDIGTEVALVELAQKYPSGESDIKTKGTRRFKIIQFYRRVPNKLYGGAEVEFLEDIDDGDYLNSQTIIGLIDELFGVMKINKDFEKFIEQVETLEYKADEITSQQGALLVLQGAGAGRLGR